MTSTSLLVVSIARALTEVALLALAGQGALTLIAGAHRDTNPVYRLFRVLTRPVLRLLRRLTPGVILDRHLPLLAFFLLFWLWLLLAQVKRML